MCELRIFKYTLNNDARLLENIYQEITRFFDQNLIDLQDKFLISNMLNSLYTVLFIQLTSNQSNRPGYLFKSLSFSINYN